MKAEHMSSVTTDHVKDVRAGTDGCQTVRAGRGNVDSLLAYCRDKCLNAIALF